MLGLDELNDVDFWKWLDFDKDMKNFKLRHSVSNNTYRFKFAPLKRRVIYLFYVDINLNVVFVHV